MNRLLDPSEDKGSKGLWTYLKAKRRTSAGVAPLKTDGKLVTDAKDKAFILNQQFSFVFTRENMSHQLKLGPSPYGPIQHLKITRNGVTKQLTKIKAGKTAGPDKLPAK